MTEDIYSKLKIITNNNVRNLFPASELTDKEITKYCLEYLLKNEDGRNSERLFRYKGWVYDVHEFEIVLGLSAGHPFIKGKWFGYRPDSYFSGIVVRYPMDEDTEDWGKVIVGWYCS